MISSSARRSSTQGTLELETINETNCPTSVQHNTEDEDTIWGHTKKHLSYQQEHDLLGLAVQTSITSLPDNTVGASNAELHVTPQDQISSCPMHSRILATADVLSSNTGEVKQMPIDRYLAEDLSDRNALLNLDPSDSAWQWARYCGCLCGKQSEELFE